MNGSGAGKRCCGGVSQLQTAEGPAGVNQTCHGNLDGVVGHGQHVIRSPKIVAIYWDQYFTNTPAAVTTMNQFLTDLVTGVYITGLSQYGVGEGSFQGSFVIDMINSPTPNSRNPGAPFSEGQMQAQLIAWLDAGVVTPASAGDETNLVYLIFAPRDTTLSLGGSTAGFCGYHQSGKRNASGFNNNLFWATVQGYAASPSGRSFVDSISYCVSHELVETFSDRDGDGYFSADGTGCEIGDLCEVDASGRVFTVPLPPNGWLVEKYWSQADRACVGPAELLAKLPVFGASQDD